MLIKKTCSRISQLFWEINQKWAKNGHFLNYIYLISLAGYQFHPRDGGGYGCGDYWAVEGKNDIFKKTGIFGSATWTPERYNSELQVFYKKLLQRLSPRRFLNRKPPKTSRVLTSFLITYSRFWHSAHTKTPFASFKIHMYIDLIYHVMDLRIKTLNDEQSESIFIFPKFFGEVCLDFL